MAKCIICKRHFERKGTYQKCCSKECSAANTKRYLKEYKQREKYKKYLNSDVYKQGRKEYKQSNNGKLSNKKYNKTDKRKLSLKRYSKTDKFKRTQHKYLNSISGKYSRLSGKLRRKERLSNCMHFFTKDEWLKKIESTNGVCPNCNNLFDDWIHRLTLDHIFALYWADKYFKQTGKKFVYTIDKVQPLCLSCNSSKQDKFLIAPKMIANLMGNK